MRSGPQRLTAGACGEGWQECAESDRTAWCVAL